MLQCKIDYVLFLRAKNKKQNKKATTQNTTNKRGKSPTYNQNAYRRQCNKTTNVTYGKWKSAKIPKAKTQH
jgi:hypothetical protein